MRQRRRNSPPNFRREGLRAFACFRDRHLRPPRHRDAWRLSEARKADPMVLYLAKSPLIGWRLLGEQLRRWYYRNWLTAASVNACYREGHHHTNCVFRSDDADQGRCIRRPLRSRCSSPATQSPLGTFSRNKRHSTAGPLQAARIVKVANYHELRAGEDFTIRRGQRLDLLAISPLQWAKSVPLKPQSLTNEIVRRLFGNLQTTRGTHLVCDTRDNGHYGSPIRRHLRTSSI